SVPSMHLLACRWAGPAQAHLRASPLAYRRPHLAAASHSDARTAAASMVPHPRQRPSRRPATHLRTQRDAVLPRQRTARMRTPTEDAVARTASGRSVPAGAELDVVRGWTQSRARPGRFRGDPANTDLDAEEQGDIHRLPRRAV